MEDFLGKFSASMKTKSFLDDSNIYTEAESTRFFSYASENKPLPFGESGMVACLPHTILRNKVSTISYLGKELLEISDYKNPGDWRMLTSTKNIYIFLKKGFHFIFKLLMPLYVFYPHFFQPEPHRGYIPTFYLSLICKYGSCVNSILSPALVSNLYLICESLFKRTSWASDHISGVNIKTWKNLQRICTNIFSLYFSSFPLK